MDLNRATILGRLTRDPELKTTPTGRNVCTFSVATGRVWVDQSGAKQEKTEFHNVVVWGKLAEIAGKYLTKGRRVYMEGRIETRNWVGTQDNVKHYRTEIIADNMIMLDAPKGSAGNTTANEDAPAPMEEPTEEVIKVEDIPF
jgi:single-strand DNA-binding protein